jgi:hypothetical protein
VESASEAVAEAARIDCVTANYRRAGYTLTLALWAVFCYIILVYGGLIAQLLTDSAASAFARSWGVGVGLGQLRDAQGVMTTVLQTLGVMVVLEALWLLPTGAWLERALDEASISATLVRSRASPLQRLHTYSKFTKAVQ